MTTPVDNTHVVYRNQPPTTESTLYTVASATSPNGEMIKEIICTNTTASNAAITLSVVPSGGTAGSANRIAVGKVIPANDFIILALSTDMAVGDFISGYNGTSGAITVTITNYQK